MKLQFELLEDDYLIHQLYVASNTKMIQNKRRKATLLSACIYLIMGVHLFFFEGLKSGGILLFLIAVLWFFVYPIFSKWRFKKFNQKYVRSLLKKPDQTKRHYYLEPDFIQILKTEKIDGQETVLQESNINSTELDKLVELENQYLLGVKSNHYIVIPKRAIQDKETFHTLMASYNLKHVNELNWEW